MYSLDGNIKTLAAKITEYDASLPSSGNGGTIPQFFEKTVDGSATNHMIRFDSSASRETTWAAITNIDGIIQGCEVGTRVAKHICDHDQAIPTGCVEEIVYQVVEL